VRKSSIWAKSYVEAVEAVHGSAIKHLYGSAGDCKRRRFSGDNHCMRLPRYDLGQSPLNSIHLFTNHPDRLLIARVGHGCDCL
jgi:hypothetical protein